MKTFKIFVIALLIGSMTSLISSCKKESKETDTTASTQAASNNALGEQIYDNVKDWSDLAMAGTTMKSTLTDTVYMGTCVLATLDMSVQPYELVIDFGSLNCQCDDGKFRRGKIICTFNGPYWATGTVITYTFENYAVDDNQVFGTKIVTNKGRNGSNHIYWTIEVTGYIIKANNGGTFYWNSDRELEWYDGEQTPFVWWDDVYMITGTASGTNPGGSTYTCTITNPLKKKLNCEWLVSGSINIQIENLPLAILDYGDGTCNNEATLTIDGQVYPISLP